MNWFSKLLKKPAPRFAAPSAPSTAQAARPSEDLEGLRAALAAATDDVECSGLATRLGLALAERAQAPRAGDPPRVRVAAICHAPDKSLALDWLAGLTGDVWLGEVATRARSAEVRFAAARRIEATGVLEQVAQSSRDKDKRVHRHCADLLRQRRQVEARDHRALEIADELRGLLDATPLPQARLLDLKKELGTLGEAGEPCLLCHGLMERALGRMRQESEALRDLHARRNAAAALAADCANPPWPWTERLPGWLARLETLGQALAGLPSWLADQPAGRALKASLGEIQTRLAVLVVEDERAQSCERFLAALEAGMPADGDRAAAWEALAKPDHPVPRQALESRWHALNPVAPPVVGRQPAPPPPPRPQPRIDHEALSGLLDKLEQAIGQGHLGDADAAAKQIKSALGGNSPHGALESRLHGLQAQLETLRGWARWGTGQARATLIARALELRDGERDVEELAVAIPALREEWKRLNAHGAPSKGQWENFDAALERAYQSVAAHRAEQSARQAQAREAKEALCAGWEAEVAGMAWEQVDFKVVEARRAEILAGWRAAPQAGFRDERALRKRLDTLIAEIDRRLDAARGAEVARRERLIAEAEALSGQPDLRLATAEAKALQQRWSQRGAPVRLRRSDEQKLWQRFRAACNAVFARLEARRAEQAAQRQEQAQSRQALLDAFAASLTGADANHLGQALARFRADWEAGNPSAREPADSLEIRARDLQRQAQRRLDELRQGKHVARFQLLAQKAALAERIEAAALAAGPIEAVVAEARQAWDGMPRLPGGTEGLIAGRFSGASEITSAQLSAGRQTRESLLLDLEIALGLPSPENCAELRRERQLERLQNRFAAALPPQSEPETLLARCYATAAPRDAAFERRIAAVVNKLAEQAASESAREFV
jgi:hypothetical protein